MSDATTPPLFARLQPALPFWLSLSLIPILVIAALHGGWTLLLMPLATWWLFMVIDVLLGRKTSNPDPDTDEDEMFWHTKITTLWFPIQFCLIFGALIWITVTDHLTGFEEYLLFFGVGVASGTIGINYSHELMHQKSREERWLADLLLASVLYSHFRSEHLLVHHRYVGTPRDPVTARYGEGFYRFFLRVLGGCFRSAFRAEAAMLRRKGLPVRDFSNPFWRYAGLQLGFLLLALVIGGWWGLFLFTVQAFTAIWQLELVNYVEHYGLTRKHLGEGKYEPVRPHHSWNADHRASNWLLINLQRHSDHHYKPDRRFPVLQTYDTDEAPQLPFSYPLMTLLALIPGKWRSFMNPRVRAWRGAYYPEIDDWSAYNTASNPAPR